MFDLNFLNFRSYVSALARGEELWCIWPAANRHWACAPMDHSENVFIRIKDMTHTVSFVPKTNGKASIDSHLPWTLFHLLELPELPSSFPEGFLLLK